MRARERIKRGNTDAAYIDLLPLRHVSDEPGEAEEANQGEELGQAEDAQRPTRVEDLETLAEVLCEKGTDARRRIRSTSGRQAEATGTPDLDCV